MTDQIRPSPLLGERMFASLNHDMDPPLLGLTACDSVYGPLVATMQYAGNGGIGHDGGALEDAEEAHEIADELALRWNTQPALAVALSLLSACNWLDADPSDTDELARAKAQARDALARIGEPA